VCMIMKTCRCESVKYSKGFALGAILAAIAVLFSAGGVQASSYTNIASGSWTDSSKWNTSGIGISGSATIIVFNPSTTDNSTNNNVGAFSLNQLRVVPNQIVNLYSSGGSSLSFENSGAMITNAGTSALTLNTPITLATDMKVGSSATASGTITMNNSITGTGNMLFATPGAAITCASVNNSGSIIHRSGGNGVALNITTVGSNVTNVTLYARAPLNITTLTMNASGTSLIHNESISANLTVNNTTGTGNLTLKHNGTYNVASNKILLPTSVNHTGAITNSGTGTGNVEISGIIGPNVTSVVQDSATSTLVLLGVNTFSCGVTIKAGKAWLKGEITPGGTGTVRLGDTGGSSSATLQIFNVDKTLSNPIVLGATSGTLIIESNHGNSITGGVTGANNLTVKQGGAYTCTFKTGSLNFSGALTNAGSAGSVTISSVIGTNVTAVVQNSTSSRLILSGTNTYTGTTTVRLGTLETQSNKCLNAASSVVIASGAKMKLNFPGTNTIQTLKLGSIDMAKGVYGSSALSPEYFEVGTGALNVLTGPPNGTLISFH
jgi:autotransporter-associated beta strand protein